MAAVLATGGSRTTKHYEKATLARQIHRDRGLRDISDRLTELNELRKDISYGEPGDDLRGLDLENIVSELELYLDEVDRLITSLEKAP